MVANTSRSNGKVTVFIADDSLIVREHLVTMLDELAGVEIVGQTESGFEAIDAISKLLPDVVILDLRMPDISGIDVLIQIKQNGVKAVVIILTNYYTFAGYRQKCLDAGADFFFWISLPSLTKSPNWLSASDRGRLNKAICLTLHETRFYRSSKRRRQKRKTKRCQTVESTSAV
jgi:DNA-binding NarL/FixJ family response regulator